MGWAGAPLLPLAAALALGIALAPWLAIAPLTLIASGAALAVSVAAALAGRRERLAALALLGGVGVIGALAQSAPVIPGDHIARRALPAPVAIEGRLVSEPVRWAPDRARLLVDIEAYHDGADRRLASRPRPAHRLRRDGAARRGATDRGRRAAPPADRLQESRRLRLSGPAPPRRHPPRGQRARRPRQSRLTPDTPPWPVAVKRWAVETIRARLPETSAALLAGLLLGERTALPRETDEGFRRAGVYHLLAVSGFNVALLASSVFATLALVGVPRRGAALAAGVVLIAFALVVGGQPSVLRATVMGLLLLLSVLLERESQVMNALALAALLLLLWRSGRSPRPRLPALLRGHGRHRLPGPTAGRAALGWGWPVWLARSLAVSAGRPAAVTPVMLALLQPALADRHRRQSLRGPARGAGHHPRHARAPALAGERARSPDSASTRSGSCSSRSERSCGLAAAVPAAMVNLPAPAWARRDRLVRGPGAGAALGPAPSRGPRARRPPR